MSDYESIEIRREDGVTEVRFHSDGGPLAWNAAAHRYGGDAFAEVGRDPETKVVIVTGTGDSFCAEMDRDSFGDLSVWEPIWWEGKRLLKNLLEIDVPVIGAINGPALVHGEIPLLADVVIAADTTVFADAHFAKGAVPGDGAHLIWPWLLGPRRAKYFLLTHQQIGAAEALELGLVNEVLPLAAVADRAWEIARELARQPLPLLRYTRETLNQFERERLLGGLSHGLAIEGLGLADAAALARRGSRQG
jgi:enoyl-CoA hydratase/carnithine racemase